MAQKRNTARISHLNDFYQPFVAYHVAKFEKKLLRADLEILGHNWAKIAHFKYQIFIIIFIVIITIVITISNLSIIIVIII